MFYEATKQGRSPELDDAILIVDECDSLIIDSNPEAVSGDPRSHQMITTGQ